MTINDLKKAESLQKGKRLQTVLEAISWPGKMSPEPPIFTTLWESQDKSMAVILGKYGKEAYRDKNTNKNDMIPVLLRDGKNIEFDPSFKHILLTLTKICSVEKDTIILFYEILYRMAYMIDHKPTGSNGGLRYSPPQDKITKLRQLIPDALIGFDIEHYLHYLDALALNEDTKYYTLKNKSISNTGRVNNILTYLRWIRFILEYRDNEDSLSLFIDIMDAFIKGRGIAPLLKRDLYTILSDD